MSWSSGTDLIEKVIGAYRKACKEEYVPTPVQERFYTALIDAFEDADWDEIDAIAGLDKTLDKVINRRYPGLISSE